MKITSTTTGRQQLVYKMKSYAGTDSILVGVVMSDTRGSVKRKHGGSKDVSRSEGENIVIIRTQAKRGRNPIFLNSTEWNRCQQFWTNAIHAFLNDASMSNVARHLTDGAKNVGEAIVKLIKEHIASSVGEKGQLKPVTRATEERKIREVGDKKSPLIHTGQLMNAFKFIIRKV